MGRPQDDDVVLLEAPEDHPEWMLGAEVTDDGRCEGSGHRMRLDPCTALSRGKAALLMSEPIPVHLQRPGFLLHYCCMRTWLQDPMRHAMQLDWRLAMTGHDRLCQVPAHQRQQRHAAQQSGLVHRPAADPAGQHGCARLLR